MMNDRACTFTDGSLPVQNGKFKVHELQTKLMFCAN